MAKYKSGDKVIVSLTSLHKFGAVVSADPWVDKGVIMYKVRDKFGVASIVPESLVSTEPVFKFKKPKVDYGIEP